jgi:hypothetical protein
MNLEQFKFFLSNSESRNIAKTLKKKNKGPRNYIENNYDLGSIKNLVQNNYDVCRVAEIVDHRTA